MIHGVDTAETDEAFKPWVKAIQDGLDDRTAITNYLNYNDYFNQHINHQFYPSILEEFKRDIPERFRKYKDTANCLIANTLWHEYIKTPPSTQIAGQPSPDEKILAKIRWTAVMTAQWLMEKDIRKNCRDALDSMLHEMKYNFICAHSLGSLVSYDYLTNDIRGQNGILQNSVYLTFGSQISFPVVKEIWKDKPNIKMPKVKQWVNLHNPHDPVFTSSIRVPNSSTFEQLKFTFGRWPFDLSAHNAASDGKVSHKGYLDWPVTVNKFWSKQRTKKVS